jgi:hypothetical protein
MIGSSTTASASAFQPREQQLTINITKTGKRF